MTTITELLQYLDTTARVSCPEITCERAAELAEVMRGLQSEVERLQGKAMSDVEVDASDYERPGKHCKCDACIRGKP